MMTVSNVFPGWLLACALVAASACTRTLMIDESAGDSGAGMPTDPAPAAPDPDWAQAGSGARPDAGSEETPLPTATTRWSGNPSGCPTGVPEHQARCDGPEGRVCAYFGDDPEHPGQSFYSECACQAFCGSSASELHWNCYQNVVSGKMDCPAEQPEQGSSCFGLKGYECRYPTLVSCKCPTAPGEDGWQCVSEHPPMREPPTGIEPATRVRDLSDAQRAAWCEWYTRPEPGFPAPPELETTADGYYPEQGCAMSSDFLGCQVTVPQQIPASACEANLALSSCEATVGDLNDCVLSSRFFHPAPRGCARYLDAAGCSGTIVSGGPTSGDRFADGSANRDCRLRVR